MTRREMRDRFRLAVWRWQDIPTPDGSRTYLRKLYLVRTPWFQVTLHWILGPDPGRDLHDHPRSFLSLMLRGAYVEERPNATELPWHPRADGSWHRATRSQVHRAPTILFRRAEEEHRLILVSPNTLTLVLWGPKRREWGFHTPIGWIHWHTYTRSLR